MMKNYTATTIMYNNNFNNYLIATTIILVIFKRKKYNIKHFFQRNFLKDNQTILRDNVPNPQDKSYLNLPGIEPVTSCFESRSTNH